MGGLVRSCSNLQFVPNIWASFLISASVGECAERAYGMNALRDSMSTSATRSASEGLAGRNEDGMRCDVGHERLPEARSRLWNVRSMEGSGTWFRAAEHERTGVTTVVAESQTKPRIELICRRVILASLDMKRQYAAFATLGEDLLQRCHTCTLAPMVWANKKIVDECIHAAVLHAEARRQYGVPHHCVVAQDKPRTA